MRFIMQPLVFYPLALLAAALIILFGIEPQRWPREPRPVSGIVQGQALVLGPPAFDAPSASPEQHLTVMRNFWGQPLSLRIAVLPNQPNPTPAERGVRILLRPDSAAMVTDKPVIAEVTYNPLNINAASGLAVSLQGIGPADWVIQEIAAQPGTVRFTLPPQMAVDAIGLRAISSNTDQAYGVEITAVRLLPQG
jgi:hypothetical protein